MLFEKQYTLTQTIETATRYRTETRTDSEGNTYTVQVPYTYYICNVKLENFDLSHLPIYILTEEQMGFYAAYMQTLGNRPDLFPNGSYPHASTPKEPTYYEIPPEALKDEAFAAMIAEAEKYVGYPYVWGGSSPSTSFDCSGFISWVINHSGWNVGRQTAQGLYNICTPVSPEQAKPGDLVFFVGTSVCRAVCRSAWNRCGACGLCGETDFALDSGRACGSGGGLSADFPASRRIPLDLYNLSP